MRNWRIRRSHRYSSAEQEVTGQVDLLEITSQPSNDNGSPPDLRINEPWWRRELVFPRVAAIVLGLQLIVLIGISIWLFSHYDMTLDYRVYFQAWYLLAHGHLNPTFGTIKSGYFWQNHLEWIMWPLALLYYVYPHGITLLFVQNLAIVGSEAVGLAFIWDIIRRRRVVGEQTWWWLPWVGLVIIAVDPWFYWSAMFDFHFHAIYGFFITAAAWQFYRRHVRLGYIFVFLCFITSVVGVTLLAPLGVLLFCWRQRRDGIIVGAIGIFGFLVEQHLFLSGIGQLAFVAPSSSTTLSSNSHGIFSSGSTLGTYLAVLTAIPRSLWSNRVNLYANLGPGGFLGIFTPVGLFIPGVVLLESILAGTAFSQPGTQNVGSYALFAVGTIVALTWISSKSLRIGKILSFCLVVNVMIWMLTGMLGLSHRTSVPSSSAAASLNYLHSKIPANAEVVADNGIVGRFAGRQYVSIFGSVIPIHSKVVYFIVSPYDGINLSPVNQELARIAFLASQPHMQLVTDKGNIWAFKWIPPTGVHSFTMGLNTVTLSAWTMKSAVGGPVVKGQSSSWYMTNALGKAGYIESGGYWRLTPGRYRLRVRLASRGPVNIEVWNSTENVMLLRRTLPPTYKVRDVSAAFNNYKQQPLHMFKGWGPFSFQPVANPSPYDQIEVRVWTDGHDVTQLYSIAMTGSQKN